MNVGECVKKKSTNKYISVRNEQKAIYQQEKETQENSSKQTDGAINRLILLCSLYFTNLSKCQNNVVIGMLRYVLQFYFKFK